MRAKQAQPVFHMRLENTLMCATCSSLFEMGVDACPACADRTLIHLTSFVKPIEFREEINLVRFMRDCEEMVSERAR